MGIRRWWLENRLRTTERKLRRLRHELKVLRTKADEKDADQRRLETRRHDITSAIDALATREKEIKAELQAATP